MIVMSFCILFLDIHTLTQIDAFTLTRISIKKVLKVNSFTLSLPLVHLISVDRRIPSV